MAKLRSTLCNERHRSSKRASEIAPRLRDALEKFDDEQNLQHVLNENPEVIGWRFSRAPSPALVRPQFRLGAEYVTDFLVLEACQWVQVYLIEIESPGTAVFNKDGTYSRRLAQAVKQTTQWKQWLLDNRRYFRDSLLDVVREVDSGDLRAINHLRYSLETDECFCEDTAIVIGRRKHFAGKEMSERRTGFLRSTDHAALYSFDALLDTCIDRFA